MKTEMIDFNFDSACTSPYISAPSSPERFGTFFFSAPTSPTHISALYGDTNDTPDNDLDDNNVDEFAFEFNGHELEKSSIIPGADELFDGGKIKPSPFESPKLSPKWRFKHKKEAIAKVKERNSSGSSRDKATRSLPPMRVSDLLFIGEDDENVDQEKTESSVSSLISLWNRTWKLKDLLLFRSASESRASSSTEELNKYVLVKKVRQEDVKNSSVSSSRERTMTRRAGPISAHELHYKMKKEMLKEMKKKTFLPYKQGLLGCSSLDDVISLNLPRRQ
ncbi:hypothetical protein RND71_037179 [Anisodus tanguticus]|uniref:Uncharacterized protein n=1 Tax=Anisodus tanguticus TaxID=243964 RepID=A0AAE1R2K7_9SOLA|nr:hypothetical protein RND71_037179 [Anisodus tanguticus]